MFSGNCGKSNFFHVVGGSDEDGKRAVVFIDAGKTRGPFEWAAKNEASRKVRNNENMLFHGDPPNIDRDIVKYAEDVATPFQFVTFIARSIFESKPLILELMSESRG
jgi:hypothetical protein